ncbi:thioredoxin [Candidatus Gracilibacteria bacterium]|nr:thioredoxin [Candidatus Gracilibacteria bacterium]
MAFKFTDANFAEDIKTGISLVDFYADWCGPCQMMGPVIDELAGEFEGKARIGKLNVDENPETSQKYGIMGIPAIKIFKDGEVVEEISGLVGKEVLVSAIEKHIS